MLIIRSAAFVAGFAAMFSSTPVVADPVYEDLLFLDNFNQNGCGIQSTSMGCRNSDNSPLAERNRRKAEEERARQIAAFRAGTSSIEDWLQKDNPRTFSFADSYVDISIPMIDDINPSTLFCFRRSIFVLRYLADKPGGIGQMLYEADVRASEFVIFLIHHRYLYLWAQLMMEEHIDDSTIRLDISNPHHVGFVAKLVEREQLDSTKLARYAYATYTMEIVPGGHEIGAAHNDAFLNHMGFLPSGSSGYNSDLASVNCTPGNANLASVESYAFSDTTNRAFVYLNNSMTHEKYTKMAFDNIFPR